MDTNHPLSGIRVTDLGWVLAIPHATAWLGTFGADVMRIESEVRPDIVRASGLARGADGINGWNRAGMFNGINYAKRSITLNLAEPRAIELVKEMVRHSDVVTENFAAGAVDRMGLGYEVLREVKPDIIMISGSPLGNSGPEKDATGWGPNTQAYSGLPYITGYRGGGPTGLGRDYPDFMVGVVMAFSLLAALHHRARTGEGQFIEVAMAETVTSTIPEAILEYTMNGREPPRLGNRSASHAPQGVYACAGDDKWVAIAVRSDEEWRAMREAMGSPAWAADERFDDTLGRMEHHDLLDQHITEWTRQRSHYEVMQQLQLVGVAAAPCLDVFELGDDPQMQALGLLVEMDHPEVGPRRIAGLPVRFSAMPHPAYGSAPLMGEHNAEVLCGLLGLPESELQQLVDEQVVR